MTSVPPPASPDDPAAWTERVRQTLARYDAALLRGVADRLLRSRIQRSPEDLIEKMAATTANVAVIDRRLRDCDAAARSLLALVGLSRQPRWRLGGILELLSGLGVADGMPLVFDLFEAGLLYPELPATGGKLHSFEEWLGRASASSYRLFAPPVVTARARETDWALPESVETVTAVRDAREADGLEWLLRLGVLWQQVKTLPLRFTQQGDFFKKDHDRLGNDPLLAGSPADELTALPQGGHFLVSLGLRLGMLEHDSGQVTAGAVPASWERGAGEAIADVWSGLHELDSWDAAGGWRSLNASPSPFGSAGLLAVAFLARLPEKAWTYPQDIAQAVLLHHCYWREQIETVDLNPWAERYLLGQLYHLKLIQAAHTDEGRWVVRLSPLGRGVLGLDPLPVVQEFPRTLFVQPNLEVIAYRQGLTPALIALLTRFCTWKSISAACTLQLQPETVYRGLETGLTHEQILQCLQQHAVRDLPPSVLQSLKTWADKRERIAVYSSATLLEFASAEELQAALARGLPALRIAERLAIVANEQEIDFRQFRLAGTRDYGLPPDQCVAVAEDGVTLTVDLARADLLLETELQRFADTLASQDGRRTYQLTPASLGRGREAGVSLRGLEDWFLQRTGDALPASVRLLMADLTSSPLTVRRMVVVEVPAPVLADGLMQWPQTRRLIHARLGPVALAVAPESVDALRTILADLGLQVSMNHQADS